MTGMKIVGYGHVHGARCVNNEEMKQYVDTNDAWIRSKTGIASRFFAEGEKNGDLASAAAMCAVSACGTEGIDAVIVATFTPDDATPSMAAEVGGRLGLGENVMTFDLNGACSGFVYGCTVANALLATGSYRRVLVVGSEKISPMMDMTDRRTCVLFGDAAGAVVLERAEEGRFVHLEGFVPNREILYCERFDPKIRMAGQEVYRFAVSKVPECAERLLELAGITAEEVDLYLFHQANERIIDSTVRKMGIDPQRSYKNIASYGNTSAASVAIALSEALEKGLVHSGETIMAVGFGAGLTYGGVLMTI